MISTQAQLREQFLELHPNLDQLARKNGTRSKRQNAQVCDIRVAWCDFVESMRRSGDITEQLAERVTL